MLDFILKLIVLIGVPATVVFLVLYFSSGVFGAAIQKKVEAKIQSVYDKDLVQFSSNVDVQSDMLKIKNSKVYQLKCETILKSLTFLDDYISWLRYVPINEKGEKVETERQPCRKPLSEIDMTLSARECYNKLFVTVDNYEIVTMFLDIILNYDKEKSAYEKFAEYKRLCRIELGNEPLNEDNLNAQNAFLLIATTKDLSNSDKN